MIRALYTRFLSTLGSDYKDLIENLLLEVLKVIDDAQVLGSSKELTGLGATSFKIKPAEQNYKHYPWFLNNPVFFLGPSYEDLISDTSTVQVLGDHILLFKKYPRLLSLTKRDYVELVNPSTTSWGFLSTSQNKLDDSALSIQKYLSTPTGDSWIIDTGVGPYNPTLKALGTSTIDGLKCFFLNDSLYVKNLLSIAPVIGSFPIVIGSTPTNVFLTRKDPLFDVQDNISTVTSLIVVRDKVIFRTKNLSPLTLKIPGTLFNMSGLKLDWLGYTVGFSGNKEGVFSGSTAISDFVAFLSTSAFDPLITIGTGYTSSYLEVEIDTTPADSALLTPNIIKGSNTDAVISITTGSFIVASYVIEHTSGTATGSISTLSTLVTALNKLTGVTATLSGSTITARLNSSWYEYNNAPEDIITITTPSGLIIKNKNIDDRLGEFTEGIVDGALTVQVIPFTIGQKLTDKGYSYDIVGPDIVVWGMSVIPSNWLPPSGTSYTIHTPSFRNNIILVEEGNYEDFLRKIGLPHSGIFSTLNQLTLGDIKYAVLALDSFSYNSIALYQERSSGTLESITINEPFKHQAIVPDNEKIFSSLPEVDRYYKIFNTVIKASPIQPTINLPVASIGFPEGSGEDTNVKLYDKRANKIIGWGVNIPSEGYLNRNTYIFPSESTDAGSKLEVISRRFMVDSVQYWNYSIYQNIGNIQVGCLKTTKATGLTNLDLTTTPFDYTLIRYKVYGIKETTHTRDQQVSNIQWGTAPTIPSITGSLSVSPVESDELYSRLKPQSYCTTYSPTPVPTYQFVVDCGPGSITVTPNQTNPTFTLASTPQSIQTIWSNNCKLVWKVKFQVIDKLGTVLNTSAEYNVSPGSSATYNIPWNACYNLPDLKKYRVKVSMTYAIYVDVHVSIWATTATQMLKVTAPAFTMPNVAVEYTAIEDVRFSTPDIPDTVLLTPYNITGPEELTSQTLQGETYQSQLISKGYHVEDIDCEVIPGSTSGGVLATALSHTEKEVLLDNPITEDLNVWTFTPKYIPNVDIYKGKNVYPLIPGLAPNVYDLIKSSITPALWER